MVQTISRGFDFRISRQSFSRALDVICVAGIDDDVGAVAQPIARFGSGGVLEFESDAHLSQVVSREAETLLGIALGFGERSGLRENLSRAVLLA